MSLNEDERRQFLAAEEKLARHSELFYGIEQSTLKDLSEIAFPRFGEKTFSDHLQELSQRGKRRESAKVLEIGGGIFQTAAIEILSKFKKLQLYVAVERRPIKEKAAKELSKRSNFRLVQAGISEIDERLEGLKFDLIFASSVIQHLPKSVFLIGDAYSRLNENGLFFCEHIPVDLMTWEEWVEKARKEGLSIEYKVENLPEDSVENIPLERKKGVNIVMQKGPSLPSLENVVLHTSPESIPIPFSPDNPKEEF